jgi:hypothetical protein
VTARRSPETVQRAGAFFIEQILFAPDADSYRVLGAGARETIRRICEGANSPD